MVHNSNLRKMAKSRRSFNRLVSGQSDSSHLVSRLITPDAVNRLISPGTSKSNIPPVPEASPRLISEGSEVVGRALTDAGRPCGTEGRLEFRPGRPSSTTEPASQHRSINFSGDERNLEMIDNAADSEPKSWLSQQSQALSEVFCSWLNLLLIFVPLGFVAALYDWGSLAVFSFNFMAIVPLAGILGAATESLAAHTGDLFGGLINATFGNAVEMIVTVIAVRAGQVGVVQGSLIGSIISNLLLVLGMAFIASGFVSKAAGFSQFGAGTNITCLVLASLALVLPTVYQNVPGATLSDCVFMSRLCAMVMAGIYCLFLIFQLMTHADSFQRECSVAEVEYEAEEEMVDMSPTVSLIVLCVVTASVAVNSHYLVHAIEPVSIEFGIPKPFIGMILLPIVGNAAEHVTAVSVAVKGKMDLTIGVAVGSSTQIALFVVPFSVIVGWIVDVPMLLDFHVFMAAVFVLSVFIASTVLGDGSANWFEGCMLVATYILVAIVTWFLPVDHGRFHPRQLGTDSFISNGACAFV